MKRTLSLVLALIMVLGTFSAVFAADVDEAADFLESVGVLLGNDDGDLMLEDNLARRDAVVLLSRLLGVSDEAAEFEYTDESPSWPDVRTDAYYLPYLAWAEVNEYFQGDDEGKFNPRNPITAQEFAVVLLRALGYADVEWADVMDKANELELFAGLEVEGKDAVVRGQMAVMILNALKAEDGRLAEELDIELPKPAALEVEDVIADNLKEVEVVFNQEVDADTVKDANIKIKNNAGKVSLKDDGVTAVITLDTRLANQKEYTLVVEKVKSADGVEIVKQELKFKTFDAELPEALEVTVTGPRNLTILFSEPLDDEATPAGKVTIKQDKVTVGNSIKVDGNKVNVTTYSNFVDGREYEVTVEGFKDYAEYLNIIEVLTFTYEKDDTPPVATVDKVEQTYLVVSFDKPVKGLDKKDFYHTFTAWTAVGIYSDAAMEKDVKANDSVDKVYVEFYRDDEKDSRAIPAGSTVFGINGKNIKDNWGNALGNVEFTISAAADRTVPEVVSIEVVGENELKIVFSKAVTFNRDNIDVLDEDGKKISGLYLDVNPVEDKAAEFTVEFRGKDLSGKTVTVSIKDVEDKSLFKNILSLYTEVLEITDKIPPEVDGKVLVRKDNEDDKYSAELIVQFDEKVDAATALEIDNYTLVAGNKVHLLDGNAEFDVIESRVKLTLTEDKAEDLYALLDDGDEGEVYNGNLLQIINVEDLAGNKIVPQQHELEVLGADAEINVGYTVEVTTTEQIVVKFDTLLANVTMNSFTIDKTKDNHYGKGFSLTQSDDDTKTTLTFDLDEAVAYDYEGENFGIKEVHGIKTVFGDKAKFVDEGRSDKIKPAVAEDDKDKKLAVLNNAGDNTVITITFEEALDEDNVMPLAVIIVDAVNEAYEALKVKTIAVGGKDLTIELDGKARTDVSVFVSLDVELNERVEAITDTSGNTAEEFRIEFVNGNVK